MELINTGFDYLEIANSCQPAGRGTYLGIGIWLLKFWSVISLIDSNPSHRADSEF